MNEIQLFLQLKKASALAAIFFAILLAGTLSFGHGPKGHTGGEFNAFQAAKKGIMLYDRLVSEGKLDESWEIGLEIIKVSKQNRGLQKEFIVKLSRAMGEPRPVYIFFSESGEYTGSNFTGK